MHMDSQDIPYHNVLPMFQIPAYIPTRNTVPVDEHYYNSLSDIPHSESHVKKSPHSASMFLDSIDPLCHCPHQLFQYQNIPEDQSHSL